MSSFLQQYLTKSRMTSDLVVRYSDRDWETEGIITTAHYNIPKSEIAVYAKGRYLPDVLRSIAHELVHMSQHEKGELEKHPMQHIGGYPEDDANARAGALVKAYGLVDSNKKIFTEARGGRSDS